VVGSLGAGVLAAVLRDRVDPKLRDPAHVTQEMGLPILGAVPHLNAANGKGARGLNGGGAGAAGPVIEALRGIRLSLVHAHGAARARRWAPSSWAPGRWRGCSPVSGRALR